MTKASFALVRPTQYPRLRNSANGRIFASHFAQPHISAWTSHQVQTRRDTESQPFTVIKILKSSVNKKVQALRENLKSQDASTSSADADMLKTDLDRKSEIRPAIQKSDRKDVVNPPETANGTSLSLLERARMQDPTAWQRMCELYAPLVYGWARKAGVSEQDAPDIVQEVFRVVTSHLARFRHDRPEDTFRGWLITLTRTEIRSFFRKLGRQVQTGEGGSTAHLRLQQLPAEHDVDVVSDGENARRAEYHELLLRSTELVRRDFAPHTWQAFWRSVVEGHPPDEIAADLNMTTNAVRQARFRVLARLRETLQ